jgi:uncharacterized phage-associated protein
MKPAATTSYDIAFWLLDRARKEDSYLQPRALQCLLFLAQAHYAAAYGGRRLMPSVFVIDDAGPLEPNLYRMLENGRPQITTFPLDEAVVVFLDAIWRRYHNDDALRLEQKISRAGTNEKAVQLRKGAEITSAAMRRMFATVDAGSKVRKTVDQKAKVLPREVMTKVAGPESGPQSGAPRVMTLYTGREVTVTSWAPARKTTSD